MRRQGEKRGKPARQRPDDRRKPPPRRGPTKAVGKPSSARPPASDPLYVFLTEPGLADLTLLELKHRKLAPRKARPLRLHLRSHDMLVLPGHLVDVARGRSRLCTNVLRAPIFGRGDITPPQLDRLAALFKAGAYRRLVSSVAGERFVRPDLMRWLERELARRDVALRESGKAIWLMVVDQAFYFGEELQNHHDAPGRGESATRSGALPPTIAAAMAFAAQLGADETVWDPTAGSGNLLSEVQALASSATLMASDVDPAVVGALARRFPRSPYIAQADAAAADLPTRALTLTIANLPFGHRYQVKGGAADLYAGILQISLRHAGESWRGLFLTSDGAALRDAARRTGLSLNSLADIKVRGMAATIWKVERA
jgi:hypothetical protein